MTPHQITSAHRMRLKGRSDSDIAAQLGITRQRVHQLLGKRPAKPPKVKPPRETVAPSDFSAALRGWRTSRGLSQSQAARLLCVTTHTVASWEQGVNGCSLAGAMLKLMDLLPE
jgi:transcriptional regulator with XRE-family HTH domain